MSDFTLQAVIAASTEQFNSAMSAAADIAASSFARVRSAFAEGAEQSTASMTRMQEQAESASHSMSESFAGIAESVRHVVEGFAVFEGLRWAKDSISEALELGEKLKNMSEMTGISTEHLQQLKFAAGATGQDFERLTNAMAQLSIKALEANNSQSRLIQSALGTLGLKSSDLNDSWSLLLKIGDAINRIGTQSTAARGAVSELFGGRAGAQLIPMISRLREFSDQAERMGLVLNSQTLDALEQAQEKFNILGQVIDVDKERIAAAFVPVLEAAAGMFTQLAERINRLAQNGELQAFAVTAADKMIDFAEAVVTTTAKVESFAGTIKRLYQFGLDLSPAYWIVKGIDSAIDKTHNLAASVGLVAAQADKASAAMRMLEQLRSQIHAAPAAGIDTSIPMAAGAAAGGAISTAGGGKDNSRIFASQASQIAEWQNQQLQAMTQNLDRLKQQDAQEIADITQTKLGELAIAKATLAQELALHQITKAQELAGEKNLVTESLAIHDSESQKLRTLWVGDQAKLDAVLAAEIQAHQRAAQQIIAIDTQLAAAQQNADKRMQADFQHVTQMMASDAMRMISQIESGHMNMASMLSGIFNQILSQFLNMTMRMVADWLASTTLIQAAWNAVQTVIGTAGTSSMASQKASAAQLAGANMIASWSAAPWPIDAAAPAMGAMAMAAAMSMAGGGLIEVPNAVSAAAGMVAHGHGPAVLAFLHAREMVLPAHISDGMQRIISGGGRGGDTHIHVSPTIHAIDAKSFEGRLEQHAEKISEVVVNHLHAQGGIYKYRK